MQSLHSIFRFAYLAGALALGAGLHAANPNDKPAPLNDRQMSAVGQFTIQLQQQGVTGVALATQVEAKVTALRSGTTAGTDTTTTTASTTATTAASGPRGTPNDTKGLGAFVVAQLDAGLSGQALADAIHAELINRGIGGGNGKPGLSGHTAGTAPKAHPLAPVRGTLHGVVPHP